MVSVTERKASAHQPTPKQHTHAHLGALLVEVGAGSGEQLDHLGAAVDRPEDREVAGAVDKVGVGARAQQRARALEAPAVRGDHEGRVALRACVGGAEDKVDVGAYFGGVLGGCKGCWEGLMRSKEQAQVRCMCAAV